MSLTLEKKSICFIKAVRVLFDQIPLTVTKQQAQNCHHV